MNRIKTFKPQKSLVGSPQFKAGSQQPEVEILRLIPLGGVGDVTKNMYVYEYGQDILLIDCGVGFPSEEMLGIDLVIPDVSYLQDKKDRIRGLVITHGHEDHIGGLPYLWPKLGCPIFAQKLAAAFIRDKFAEFRLPKEVVRTVEVETVLKLGVFTIRFYQVTHAVPDSVGVIIDTPVGKILHQSDFKIDWTPVSGQVTEVGKVAQEGDKGVLLMLIDALKTEKPGYNLSEKTIQPTFERVEKDTKGKLLITMTSSNITRIQQAINVAVSSGRKLMLVGRSMESNFQTAHNLGYLDVPPHLVVPMEEVKHFPDHKLLILIAGSQGQPGSALSRVANNDHRFVSLEKDDAVVFSADPIPSTEAAQNALIDQLTRMGVDVYYPSSLDPLHVSGHAAREEVKLMIGLARPKYLMPIGATFKQMKFFAKVVAELGYGEDRVMLAEDGRVIKVTKLGVSLGELIPTKNVYVDGLGVGDVGSVVLRDRQVMADEGVVIVMMPVDAHTGDLAGEVDIISRGFVFEKEAEELLHQARMQVEKVVKRDNRGGVNFRFIKRSVEETLEKFFYEKLKRQPLILPVLVEV